MKEALKFYRDLENEKRRGLGLEELPEATEEAPAVTPKEEIMVDGGFKVEYSAVEETKPVKKSSKKK